MGRVQKILTTVLWGIAVLFMLGVIGTWASLRNRPADSTSARETDQTRETDQSGTLPVLYPVPAFSLTDQNERTVSDQDLRGQVWVAAFIFTNCAGPCPMMSAKMAKLQTDVPDKHVKLVSVTVDPERDTPAVLREYAKKFSADESRWHFLTGPVQQIYDLANGLKLAAVPASEENPIIHSSKLLLIDAQGRVRGIYSTEDPQGVPQLAHDASALARDEVGGGSTR